MEELNVSIRKKGEEKTTSLRTRGLIPAILYGSETKTTKLYMFLKEFVKVFQQVGESSLFRLNVESYKEKPLVLIHEIQRNSVSGEIIHVDFFRPKLTQKIEAKIPVVLEGEAPAVRELGGTLIKNIQEITVKAFPQDLPKEITVSVTHLITFDEKIFIKDIPDNANVEILNDPEEIIAQVAPPEKVEEELKKPVEEKVEEVEKVEKQKKEEESEES